MKLEKFTKNKKQKRIVIGSIVGILLIIGGITLYKTFALYKVEKSFDILEGKVPDFRSDVMLALTVNGKAVEEFPKQDSTTYAIKVNCDKGTGVWNRETWGLEIKNIEKNKVKCNVEFTTLTGNQTFDFDYKGKEDAISLPKGKYRLEVWGAQGGHNETTKATGGLGGYSKGEITLTTNDILYINVGGQGEGSSERNEGDTIYKGGYNGGGNGVVYSEYSSSFVYITGGGGATHIAKVSGLLSTLERQREQILIVAGGGGGTNGNYSYGGSGGGFKGANGVNTVDPYTGYLGTGGSQEAGGYSVQFADATDSTGTFGQGGMAHKESGRGLPYAAGAGGGGGYYGGGGSARHHSGAGGGSGYIGNTQLTNKDMWCYQCEQDTNENTKTNSTDKASEEAISEHAKQGNGYARITYLGS